ncbi:MAG: thioesterase family protein [Caulobacter sp.]|nr:thioesterase family protein [Caulobacter sp.]
MPNPFFDLRASHNPHRWHMPLTPEICVGPPGNLFMYGGIGLAASISALEQTCGRPVIWATAQYLSYARPPSIVDFDVRIAAAGKYTTQARVSGHVGEGEIITVNAALGARPDSVTKQWVSMPDLPPPEDCEPVLLWPDQGQNLNRRIEMRTDGGRYGIDTRTGEPSADGRMQMWLRTVEDHAVDASLLAVFADYVPSGLGPALGLQAGGNSLDNTLRVLSLVPTRWVLADIAISGVHAGVGHGAMNLFAETGELMAVASQSMIVRVREE